MCKREGSGSRKPTCSWLPAGQDRGSAATSFRRPCGSCVRRYGAFRTASQLSRAACCHFVCIWPASNNPGVFSVAVTGPAAPVCWFWRRCRPSPQPADERVWRHTIRAPGRQHGSCCEYFWSCFQHWRQCVQFSQCCWDRVGDAICRSATFRPFRSGGTRRCSCFWRSSNKCTLRDGGVY